MKKFLTIVVALSLLLIVAFSSFACANTMSVNDLKKLTKQLSNIKVETSGYKLVKADTYLPQKLPTDEWIIIDNEIYTYFSLNQKQQGDESYDGYLKIKKMKFENGEKTVEKTIEVDKMYLKDNCAVFIDLFRASQVEGHTGVDIVPNALIEFDDKLFIYCKGHNQIDAYFYFLNEAFIFPMIFEYDLKTEQVKYAGFISLDNEDDFFHQKYMIVKE